MSTIKCHSALNML